MVLNFNMIFHDSKVHIYREGHKMLRNIHLIFDWHYIGQMIHGYFAKICGLLRIYELYKKHFFQKITIKLDSRTLMTLKFSVVSDLIAI